MHRFISIVVVAIGLTACTSTQMNQWVEDPWSSWQVIEDSHVVKKGETLYSIAQEYQLSHSDLAKWNDIDPPDYAVVPGQYLSVSKPLLFFFDFSALKWDTLPGAKVLSEPPSTPDVVAEDPPLPEVEQPPSASHPASRATPSADEPLAMLEPDTPRHRSKLSWAWPLRQVGKPVAYRRGIRLHGQPGANVFPASDGVVVYSGFGLKQYGGLIIIRHPDNYFTAYGFVDQILVEVGDTVEKDRAIAMLSKAQEQAKLYFALRRKNHHLNPIKYMPKRS